MRACIWQFTVLFLKFTKPAHEHHLQAFKVASQAYFLARLAPIGACIWQFTVLLFGNLQNRPMSTICKLSKLRRKPAFLQTGQILLKTHRFSINPKI
jgi:hypothetical protein